MSYYINSRGVQLSVLELEEKKSHAGGQEVRSLSYKRLVHMRHEPEICKNFEKKIRECLGCDSDLEFLLYFSKTNDDESLCSTIAEHFIFIIFSVCPSVCPSHILEFSSVRHTT